MLNLMCELFCLFFLALGGVGIFLAGMLVESDCLRMFKVYISQKLLLFSCYLS